MDLLRTLTVFLAIFLEYPASAFGVKLCTKDSSLPSEIYSSQPELMRLAREYTPTKPEPILWGNPCNYPNGIKNAAKTLYGAKNFKRLVNLHKNDKWLQSMPWMTNDVLPKEKEIFKHIPYDKINEMMPRINTVLPKLHKATKMVLSGLRVVSFYGVCHDAIIEDVALRPNLDTATRDVRTALCQFSQYLEKRGLKSEWMYELEEPNLYNSNISFLILRDAINFLAYLDQVFDMLL